MSTTSREETVLAAVAPKSLANVAAWLTQNTAIPPRKQADFASALATYVKLAGKPLHHIPASVSEIRRFIDGLSPVQCGMKTPSYRNFKSRIFKLLALSGCPVVPARHSDPLIPSWQALWDRLRRRLRYDLSHVMHWHSARGIPPEEAGQATFDAYYKDVVEHGTKERRRQYYQSACLAWDRASQELEIFPKVTVEVPVYRKRKARPWSDFDPGFQADTNAYLASIAKTQLPSKPSSASVASASNLSSHPWRRAGSQEKRRKKKKFLRPETIKRREFDIRLFASFAQRLGFSVRSLRDLVSHEIAGAVIDDLWVQADETPTTYISGFVWMIRGIADRWVRVDDDHLKWIDDMLEMVEPKREGMTPQNRARLDQVRDPDRELALRWLPNRLAERAGKADRPTEKHARVMMRACIVGLFMYCPMRRRNVADIRLDRHLHRIPNGKSTYMVIEIPGGEVKNGVPTRYPVPDEIAKIVEDFIQRYRHLICNVDCPWLFPTRHGRAIHRNAISPMVRKIIWDKVGVRWNPHLFRHWAGTIHLEEHPGEHETVRRLLHHEKLETSRSYLGNDGEAETRHYQTTVLKRRARLAQQRGIAS